MEDGLSSTKGYKYLLFIKITIYLFFLEGEMEGLIKWKFKIDENTQKCIDKVEVRLDYAVYENGEVNSTIEAENERILYLSECLYSFY